MPLQQPLYGDGTLGFADDEAKLETLRPLNPYCFSKHLVDLWMKRGGVLNPGRWTEVFQCVWSQ